jgi:hypothetical protein
MIYFQKPVIVIPTSICRNDKGREVLSAVKFSCSQQICSFTSAKKIKAPNVARESIAVGRKVQNLLRLNKITQKNSQTD